MNLTSAEIRAVKALTDRWMDELNAHGFYKMEIECGLRAVFYNDPDSSSGDLTHSLSTSRVSPKSPRITYRRIEVGRHPNAMTYVSRTDAHGDIGLYPEQDDMLYALLVLRHRHQLEAEKNRLLDLHRVDQGQEIKAGLLDLMS